MKKEQIDLSMERVLVTLLIMSDEICAKLIPIIKPQYMQSAYARQVVEWIIEYHGVYKVSPKTNIQAIFEQKRAYVDEDDILESIGEFLSNLSESYDPDTYTNTQYWCDSCAKYISECSLKIFRDKLTGLIDVGDHDRASQLISTYTQAGVPQDVGIDILHDHDAIREAILNGSNPLFVLQGDLGLVANDFYRQDVSCWLGKAKAGKSWAMIHTGHEAMCQGNKVTYVSLEMRKEEALVREAMNIQWNPKTERDVQIPYFHPELEPYAEEDDETRYSITSNMVHKTGLDLNNLDKIENEFKMRTGGGGMRFFFLPAEATTIESIEALLDNLAFYQNWVTDVLVIDYADLLSAGSQKEYRHGIDYIYRNLRRIAQVRNIHVCTASQSNYTSDNDDGELTEANIAEDKRKLGHVAKLLALYNTKEERARGIIHVKSIVDRYEPKTYDTVIVLQALSIGKFSIDSKLLAKVVL